LRQNQEYLTFLKHIGKEVPERLDIHAIFDNYATHKHAKIRRWIACHPRWHIHSTSTYSSWLNQVEIWFNLITQQAIRRGIFASVKELVNKIQQYTDNYKCHPRPFVWTATIDSILAKIERLYNYQ
jgi:putative transposase